MVSSILLSVSALFSFTEDPAAAMQFFRNYRLIRSTYFRSVSDAALFEGATKGMVESLQDPYSAFLTGEKYDSLMQATSGEYGGIGVLVGMDKDNHFRILYVFPESAALKSGLKAGDELLSIDGQSVSDMSIEDAAEHIRGAAGTTVTLALDQNGREQIIPVVRSNITLPTVRGEMRKNGIGYIRIFSFTKHTPEEFKKEYQSLRIKGMDKMIIDLRMNPGGMIDSVVAVADQILTKGNVVSFRDKSGRNESFNIQGVEKLLPMAVLIDRNSASASEILAGAVQDKQEGTVIGEKSFGKGTVQTIMETEKGTAMKLSIAEYLTAAGRQIDKKGILPDIAVPQEGIPFDLDHDSVFLRAESILNEKN